MSGQASALGGFVLLDTTTYLTWSVVGGLDDVTGVEHACGVLELVINGVLAVTGRVPVSRFAPRTEVFSTLF